MSRPTQVYVRHVYEFFVYATLTLFGGAFQPPSTKQHSDAPDKSDARILQPRALRRGLGSSRFARHY